MDRLMALRTRIQILIGFLLVVLSVLGFKALQQGWFAARPQLELNGQPTLLFFTLSEGCDCQMRVVLAAEAQLAKWPMAIDGLIPVMRVDFDHWLDLARLYHVARAPALVLLDGNGEVVWKVDESQSDKKPFDMVEVEEQVASFLAREGR